MSINAVAHLNFRGQARAALEFYQSVFGGQLTVTTYGDFGMPAEVPGSGNVVYGEVVGDNGFHVMAYDVPGPDVPLDLGSPTTRRENGTTITQEPFFLSVSGDDADEVSALWERLADGAAVVEPYGPSQWAPGFGMLTDRFGITWILNLTTRHAGA